MKVIFRLDATKEIGIGHMMRCLALAEELIKKGVKCYFFSDISDIGLVNQLKRRRIKVKRINFFESLRDDLKNFIRFCNEKNIDWIITDHYKINSEYLKSLKNNGFKVLSIDDLAQTFYYSDIVVNQNIYAYNLNIRGAEKTKFLLGTKFVMIRDELLKRNEKIYNKSVKNILITLGGSDNNNLTYKVLKNIEEIDDKINIIVISGPYNNNYKDLRRICKKSSKAIKLVNSPNKMLDIYLKSDIAISAGGSTCYELSYFGIPNIIITTANNQLKIARELDKRNISINIGKGKDFYSKKLKEKLIELIDKPLKREKMLKNGMSLVDGKGKERIVDCMKSLKT